MLFRSEVGVPEGHHDVSHHGGDRSRLDKLRRINQLHVGRVAHLLGRLKSAKEGGKSLLDRCLVVYGSGCRRPCSGC